MGFVLPSYKEDGRRLKTEIHAGSSEVHAFDTQEHPMATLIGNSYQSSTLSQFLGQLERIAAASWLMAILLPAQSGKLVYVDGHMIAYWSRSAAASWRARKP